jgi:hypothetical protein
LYLKIETQEPLVVIENIGLVSYSHTYSGGSSTSQVITAPTVFTNPLTTINGQSTMIVIISTALPSNFCVIARRANAVVTANGRINFAPSTVRKLLRPSNTAALPQAGTSITASVSCHLQINGQQGGFSIGVITLAKAEETSGAETLHSG